MEGQVASDAEWAEVEKRIDQHTKTQQQSQEQAEVSHNRNVETFIQATGLRYEHLRALLRRLTGQDDMQTKLLKGKPVCEDDLTTLLQNIDARFNKEITQRFANIVQHRTDHACSLVQWSLDKLAPLFYQKSMLVNDLRSRIPQNVNNKEEVTETFQEMARTVVDQELRGTIEICEKLTQRADGTYVSYVALELSGQKIADAYNSGLSQNEKIKADYNYEKFKETFEKEMAKFSEGK